ncbi:MAG: SDR family oxidoreductase [Arthrobacter sp.]|jgi:NAD(P)-dependent dehydrogenase (short-subunit alcohol dehydrogenase family)|nr:SDR family oxidoreductase [Arthrobacter sp.]
MDLHLSGRVVIVSGAALGIGYQTVRLLAQEGVTVVAGDLDVTPLQGVDNVLAVQADLATAQGCQALVDAAISQFGRVDGLVNNVGVFPYRDGFLATTLEDWRRTIDINFFSMVQLTQLVLPHMMDQGNGSIVSVASECGRQPDVFFVDYSVTKAMVLNLSKSLANEFGQHGIRSNVVSPGPTRTASWDKPGGFAQSLADEYGMDREAAIHHFATEVRKLPVGHIGAPEDVAAAITFLVSDVSRQVTGAEYTVNGGSYIAA